MALYSVAKRTHWLGVFLLLISTLLLLITTLAGGVLKDFGLLKVTLTNQTQIRNSSVTFGSFGYCVLDVPPVTSDQDWCSASHFGYAPADIMARIDNTPFSEIASGTSDSLTRVMVLHPVASALSFLSFIAALGSGVLGSLVGAFLALIAWLLVLVSIAVDFTFFGIVCDHVNNDKSGSVARFGPGIWTLLASFVTLFLGMGTVFLTCCAARREKKRAGNAVKHEGYPSVKGAGVPA